MLILGIRISGIGLGSLCWMLLNLTAALAAYHSGARAVAGVMDGVVAGAVTPGAWPGRIPRRPLTSHSRHRRCLCCDLRFRDRPSSGCSPPGFLASGLSPGSDAR